MKGQVGRSGLFAAAAVLFLSACGGGDTGEQTVPPDDAETGAPEAPAEQPSQSTVGANVELPEGVTREMVAQGEQIFNQQICFSCHGVSGAGSPLGPVLADEEWLNTDGSYDGIMNIVRTGVPEPVEHPGPMPAMGGIQLSDEQIRQVSAYVYAISHGG
ncbi:MAG TPA: cytochrome c [Longimicrobiales bacterium]|nr:cytochrome c [Longimicrobiales bacterium]